MAKIRCRKETETLFLDFFFKGARCREQTALTDSVANRKRLQKVLDKIEAEIEANTFDYAQTFPTSKMAKRFAVTPITVAVQSMTGDACAEPVRAGVGVLGSVTGGLSLPTFNDFADTWVAENDVAWRPSPDSPDHAATSSATDSALKVTFPAAQSMPPSDMKFFRG